MESMKEWAEFYFSNKIYIIPDTECFEWAEWRSKIQTIEDLRGYDWASSKEVYAIIGKKGIRALSISGLENVSIDYKNLLVERALSLLGLPFDYPWVVDYGDAICVIIESADDRQGLKSQKFRDIELLWQDTLCLPTAGSEHFYYGELPKKRPTHISNDVLLNCFEMMRKDRAGETDWPYFCGQIQPDKLPILDSFNSLSKVGKFDIANHLLIGCWYMRDEGLHKIHVKESGELIERTGREWQFVNTTEWSYGEQSTKKGTKKHVLHIKGIGSFNIIYVDEHILYAKNQNEDKMFLVKEDAVDSFKNNDDVVFFFSQIENRAAIQDGSSKSIPKKKSGCLIIFGVTAFILMCLLI